MTIWGGGNPSLRRNRISQNGYAAIRVHDGGRGTIEENDLRGNAGGAWDIAPDCLWFVFPQLAGLGRSSTARLYATGSLDEARAYLAHPVLGPRLDLCTRIVLASESPSVRAIFRSPDDLKFRSCMTLFARAVDDSDNPFRQALDRWCGGQPDDQRLALID